MILDVCFSSIGRTSQQHLNNLRRQLGTGVDPAFDYSKMLELQKKLAQAGKQGLKQRSDRAHADGRADPTSGLDLLKRTLKEVVGVGAGIEEADSEQGDGATSKMRARSSPAHEKEQRESNRNTHAFMASSRESLKKLDIENRFRAPPLASYRPKDVMLRPKHVCHEFSRTGHAMNLAGTPREPVSIELKEGVPDRARSRSSQRNYLMAKDLPRPDMLKSSKIQMNDNTFTAGVLDGHERVAYPRLPSWDFAKTSTAPEKQREYYFQPGQYAVKLECSRPKLELKNIPFDQQTMRKPDIIKRATQHVPDRSLARPSALSASCPILERRVRDVHIAKCTNRKPIYEYIPPMYDASDPKVEEAVLRNFHAFDIEAAVKITKPNPKPSFEFKKDLTRLQQLRTSRVYGNDVNLSLARANLTQGPVSVELLPMDSMHEKPSVKTRVIVTDLKHTAGREVSKDHIELPPRGKVEELSKVMNFGRGIRSGDSRADTQNLSRLAGAITELRGTRSYDALPREDHPRPSEME